jgi:predicted ABC-type ATPase
VFLWLPSADFAVQRVADRVRLGGHGVPEATIRRRYHLGLRNFFRLYQPLATTWGMFDNSGAAGLREIAAGQQTTITQISDAAIWQHLIQEYGHDTG